MCDFQGSLVAWIDGELPAHEADEVQTHIRVCTECRSKVEAYKRVSGELDAYCDTAALPVVRVNARRPLRMLSGVAAAAAAAAVFLIFPRTRVEKPRLMATLVAQVAPAAVSNMVPAAVKPESAHRIHRPHVVAPVQARATNWVPPERTIEIAIPADAMYPPGAVPEGMSFIVDVRLAADGSAQQFGLWP